MTEAVQPPDAEAVVIAYLKTQFTSRGETATVAGKVPQVRPDRMVRVSLVNTRQQTPGHFYASVLVECWDVTNPAASALARKAYAILCAIEGDDTVSDWVPDVVTVGGPANFPDPDVGPRYQFTLDLLMSGDVI
ncbi:hypothetical protein [Nocardia wallacei]|uniref:hypothetical protein n=1 Tax=Nocardia wallacei TaxID=480035 RepID=UPI002455C22B|nr:hypothetical protein [Nocardia wallacei]